MLNRCNYIGKWDLSVIRHTRLLLIRRDRKEIEQARITHPGNVTTTRNQDKETKRKR